MDVDTTAVVAAMRACGVRTLIHGHTHRPGMHEFELDGAPARRMVLGAWHHQGSCLAGGTTRSHWNSCRAHAVPNENAAAHPGS